MDKLIKDYWYNLKLDYKSKYFYPIFTNYEKLKLYVERFKLYFENILK